MGKKRNVKKGKTWEKNGLVHLHFCCFFFAFSICFFLLLFCFFLLLPGKKAKKSKIKAKKSKSKKHKKTTKMQWTSPCFSHFSPFLFFLFVSFFSLLFCFCVFWILLICFLGFPFVLHFSRFFSSFKKIRISYGLVNIIIRCHKHIPWRTIIWLNYPQEPKVIVIGAGQNRWTILGFKSPGSGWVCPSKSWGFRWLSLEFWSWSLARLLWHSQTCYTWNHDERRWEYMIWKWRFLRDHCKIWMMQLLRHGLNGFSGSSLAAPSG